MSNVDQNDAYRCRTCDEVYVVPSLARSCERKHPPADTAERVVIENNTYWMGAGTPERRYSEERGA